MGIRIIRGAIGAGKSECCLDEIKKIHEKYPEKRCVMIVPNHYSYDTEKRFVEDFGGTGLNNIEVLTLRKMAINHLTAADLKYLTPAGKQMLIYKAVHQYCSDTDITDASLLAAIQKNGFLDVVSSLISEMKRYSVTPDMLFEKNSEFDDNLTLQNKLSALSDIYKGYEELVENSGYTDSEDDIKRLAEFIASSDKFDNNMYVWFDKFDEFMPHQISVIEAMLKRGVNVTVCVTYPENGGEIYSRLEGAYLNIERLLYEYGGDSIELGGELKHLENNAELKFLFENWDNHRAKWENETENISLFESRDTYSEVEETAARIVDLVREYGMRYRDIAVLCGNADEYKHILETVFAEYEIPYFTDSTIILSDHPIAMQVLSVFDILDEDWSINSVFAYLRAGYIYREIDGKYVPINQDEIDRLENFVLKFGIRGQSRWLSDNAWTSAYDIITAAFGGEQKECGDFAENLRQEIIAPIREFKEKTARRKTGREHAKALYEYFESINLYQGLKSEITRFKLKGMVNEAEQFTKIWNLLLDVLNQTVITIGENKINREEFFEYIRVGLSKCEIRIIPSGIDQVYAGTVERSSQSNVRAMFVIGAVSGTFPDEFNTEGFLSNSDRNMLLEHDIKIAPDTKKKTDKQYFKVYKAMCAVTEKLFLSYPVQTSEGKALSASRMILDIKSRFPNIKKSDNLTKGDDMAYISSPKATIHKMLIGKSANGRSSEVWEAAYKWYEKSGEWDKMLALIERAKRFSKRHIRLDVGVAREIYSGKGAYSASRLNSYAKCPFQYFMRYGINAYPRDEWEISPADVGNYAHLVIREFCETVEDGAKTAYEKLDKWRGLRESREDGAGLSREEILDGIIDKTRENIMQSNNRDKEKTANIFGRMGKTIKNAARIVHLSFKNGEYAENGMERHFEIKLTDNIAIKGDIDRVDMYNETGNDARVRIIDYKTGKTEFDVTDIFNRVDMQPVIYAIAAREMAKEEFNKDASVTGIYYNRIRDDFAKLNSVTGEDKLKSEHDKSRKLDGVTFVDEYGDNRVIYSMDSDIENGNASEFLKIPIDTKGEIKLTEAIKTRAHIDGLMEKVRENIIAMDGEINDGSIAQNPYGQGKSNACAYCDYADVCAFDSDRKYERKKEGKKQEIWDSLYEKGGGTV